ncbi:MAG TPA: Spx/MgsR family RNA polymerase-binding regulatory protein [Candidatus Eremiobacteraeota bacterium]|nr:MAG: Regulatory protein Spx [bacterium ADurb.Bin363]HPZ06585.1 Spx/MgsR family RNA polymerase-binding regulatory protein [Candidatus Eremiobacteraeota bacterium]
MINQKFNYIQKEDDILLYYKPMCIGSRRAREFLMKKGIPFKERNLDKYPLKEDELRKIMLGHSAEEFVAKKSQKYKKLNLENEYLTGEEMLKLIAKEPSLLKRPIIVKGDEIIIGYSRRRVENYLIT